MGIRKFLGPEALIRGAGGGLEIKKEVSLVTLSR